MASVFFSTSPATRFFNDAAKLKYFSFSALCRTITIDRSIMFRGHIGCQTSYQRKFDRLVEEIPVHVRTIQKDTVIGDDSIRIHQNNAIGFFVKVNVNRFWMIFVACFIGYLFLKRYHQFQDCHCFHNRGQRLVSSRFSNIKTIKRNCEAQRLFRLSDDSKLCCLPYSGTRCMCEQEPCVFAASCRTASCRAAGCRNICESTLRV